jgi:hypothetical protein
MQNNPKTLDSVAPPGPIGDRISRAFASLECCAFAYRVRRRDDPEENGWDEIAAAAVAPAVVVVAAVRGHLNRRVSTAPPLSLDFHELIDHGQLVIDGKSYIL